MAILIFLRLLELFGIIIFQKKFIFIHRYVYLFWRLRYGQKSPKTMHVIVFESIPLTHDVIPDIGEGWVSV